MKESLTTSQAAHKLLADEYAAWTYAGAHALIEYFEEIEHPREEIELDVVAIRCEFSEYETALEAAAQYDFEPDPDLDEDEQEEAALEYLQDHTTIITFDGGVIIQDW